MTEGRTLCPGREICVGFGVLGLLTVSVDGREVALGAAKPRALLIRLLIDVNRGAPVDRLIEDLWEGSPPNSAGQTLQSYISRALSYDEAVEYALAS